jgi:hypothetical protein
MAADLAASNIRAAAPISDSRATGGAGGVAAAGVRLELRANTSMGISICTGRGRAEAKSAKASAKLSPNASAENTVREKAVSGAVTARWSVTSCSMPQPWPRLSLEQVLEITSMRMESE